MRRSSSRLVLPVVALATLWGFGDAGLSTASARSSPASDPTPQEEVAPAAALPARDEDGSGTLLVKFKEGTTEQQIDQLARQFSRRHHKFLLTNKKQGRHGPAFFDTLARLDLDDPNASERIQREISQHPLVQYVEPSQRVSVDSTTPNDPGFASLWGLNNTGQTGGTPDADIDAPEAWDLGTGNSQVIVGVIDTGVDYTHPDLAANMWINIAEIAGNGLDDDGNGYVDDIHGADFVNRDSDPKDDHFHGTHVSGTIGAVGNNGIGVAGVCWSVRIMALKFLSSTGSGTTTDAITAIQYAINNGAHILSNSWGGGGYSQALQDAVWAANNAGLLFIAAAGNSNTDQTFYPASLDGVLTVSATDHADLKASFSNFGSHIDVAAPGVSIYSTVLNQGYGYASGTSMACPHVAGLAALLKGRNLSVTKDTIELILKSSADDLGASGQDNLYGWGRINARRAMEYVTAGNYPTVVISSPTSNVSGSINVVGTASGSTFSRFALDYRVVGGANWVPINSSTTPVQNGVLGSLDTTTVAEGRITLRLTVTDTLNNNYFTAVTILVDNIAVLLSLPPSARRNPPSFNVIGSAGSNYGTFIGYSLSSGTGFAPATWSSSRFSLTGGGASPVSNNVLGVFDLSGLEGFITVRLTVTTSIGSEIVSATFFVEPYLRAGSPFVAPGQWARNAATMGDLDGTGSSEVIFPFSNSGWSAYTPDGQRMVQAQTYNGYVMLVGSPITLSQLSATPGLECVFYNTQQRDRGLMAMNQTAFLPGFPSLLPGTVASYHPSTCVMAYDLNRDGNDDLIFPTFDSSTQQVSLHAIDRNGTELPGFPFSTGYSNLVINRAGAVADVDGDGNAEIFFTVRNELYNPSTGTTTYGNANIFGVTHQGVLLNGFPVAYTPLSGALNFALGDVVIGDITGSSEKEILFCETAYNSSSTHRFVVHALNRSGREVAGWPYRLEGLWYLTGNYTPADGGLICLGDVTGDGRPEAVVSASRGLRGSWNGSSVIARVIQGDGTLLHSYPDSYTNEDGVRTTAGAEAITVLDIDGDLQAEVLIDRQAFYGPASVGQTIESIFIYKGSTLWMKLPKLPLIAGDGSTWYPTTTDGQMAPMASDIDNDGQMELVQVTQSGNGFISNSTMAYIWDLPYPCAGAQLEWPFFQANRSRTGEYVPRWLRGGAGPDTTPPTVVINSPANGSTVRGQVTITASATDLSGINRIEFLVNGSLKNTDTTAPYSWVWNSRSYKGSTVTLTARAFDNAGNSSSASISVVVR